MEDGPFHLFEVIGVELEYMIVDRETLDVRPIADDLLKAASVAAGETGEQMPGDVEFGPVTWSNELVAHVVELKSTAPVSLDDPANSFHRLHTALLENVRRANSILSDMGACLLPTAMHPWMNPALETRLWPHDYAEVYRTFDRLFDCRSHGWANLQSSHINLPFSGDEEFARLHAAIRLVLPILPALAASSPVVDGTLTGILDNRLDVYRRNCTRAPSFTGAVIPEAVFSRQQYEESILDPIRKDIESLGAAEHLKPEFSNARGAIARFDRGAIEIRLLDMQEQPAADVVIVVAVQAVAKALCEERWCSLRHQKSWSVERLGAILDATIRSGGDAVISDSEYLSALGYPSDLGPCTAEALWDTLIGPRHDRAGISEVLDMNLEIAWLALMNRGCLAHRITTVLQHEKSPDALARIYRCLATRLERGECFWPADSL